jgi:prepilin-type N-terminal cleavage/methylation domain-containing protein
MKTENCKMMNSTKGRRGFTLVEMLVAMALTLILVYSIAEFYAYIGNAVRDGRATIELGGQLRAASQQLHDDLNSLTLRPSAWVDNGASSGYFTIYEGPGYDGDPDGNGITTKVIAGETFYDIAADSNNNQQPDMVENNITTLYGDGDDVLAMTIQAKGVPFQGRYYDVNTMTTKTITSQYAEVVWFTTFDDMNGDGNWDIGEPRILCRRLLLIRPDLTPYSSTQFQYTTVDNSFDFWDGNDISVHMEEFNPPMGMKYWAPIANSLQSLTFRQNRFGCRMTANAPRGTAPVAVLNNTAPSHMDINPGSFAGSNVYTMQGAGFGEDRVIPNVLAFDVRVFDPAARIYQATASQGSGTLTGATTKDIAVTAGDAGYTSVAVSEGTDPLTQTPAKLVANTPSNNKLIGLGAYVDLYYNQGLSRESAQMAYTVFSRAPVNTNFTYGIWDTWSRSNLISIDPDSVDGLDGDNANGVDDAGERAVTALPPYPTPLRGIQVRLRVYEPQTRQARQVTVGADFLPE